jgi:phosphoenolpyruvate carboxykinase (ATP)
MAYLQGRDVFVQDLYAGADRHHQIALQVICESAWHALFARTVLILDLTAERVARFAPEYTLIHVPHFRAIPELDGTRSEVFVILDVDRREILIGGTQYAGELKKAVFTLLNYLLPRRGVLSMHCSANVGHDHDDVALFFGLSGTGKTTLSIDHTRLLVGDDEHGWGERGVFNLEGGCYAKVIRISPEDEPQIYRTTRMFGTLIENVVMDRVTRRMDLDADAITENTRAAFPITHLDNASRVQTVGHPRHVFFLSADAFGVLPPLARLAPDQALFYFLLGYTAKVAGTERGVKSPQATFSPCFGAPFMPLQPTQYADMLGRRLRQYGSQVWLVNTGWSGGGYGQGRRMPLKLTRALVRAAMEGALDAAAFETEPAFGLALPRGVPGVPDELLHPAEAWPDREAYAAQAAQLKAEFAKQFAVFADAVAPEVAAAAP